MVNWILGHRCCNPSRDEFQIPPPLHLVDDEELVEVYNVEEEFQPPLTAK